MSRRVSAWILGVCLLLPAAGGSSAGAPIEGKAATADDSAGAAWRKPFAVIERFFGLPADSHMRRADAVQRLRAAVAAMPLLGAQAYRLKLMIALLPDPIEARMPAAFQEALDAIDLGFAYSSPVRLASQRDRRWLPWADSAAAAAAAYRAAPGLLLYRQDDGPLCTLIAVLVVGESQSAGVHTAAFREALRIAGELGSPTDSGEPEPMRILGPSFASSIHSLRMALLETVPASARPAASAAPAAPANPAAAAAAAAPAVSMPAAGATPTPGAPPHFLIVSATALAPCLEQQLALPAPASVAFYRTQASFDIQLTAALGELHQRLGWNLAHAALIVDVGAAYGGVQPPQEGTPTREGTCSTAAALPRGMLLVRVPANLAAMSAAHLQSVGLEEGAVALITGADPSAGGESDPAAGGGEAAKGNGGAAAATEKAAGGGTTGSGGGGGSVAGASLEAVAGDLALSGMVQGLSLAGVQYAGILASDVRDTLLLANRLHTQAPNVSLFTVGGDLLFLHPRVHPAVDGMTIISSAPLFAPGRTFGSTGAVGANSSDAYGRLPWQLTSTAAQAVYEATVALLSPVGLDWVTRREGFQIWLSVAGNDALWPISGIVSGNAGRPTAGGSGGAVARPAGGGAAAGPSSGGAAAADPDTAAAAAASADQEHVISLAQLAAMEAGGWRDDPRPGAHLASSATPVKADLELLAFAAGLAFAGWSLRRAALLPAPPAGGSAAAGTRRLLVGGLILLIAADAGLLVLAALPRWGWLRASPPPVSWTLPGALSFLVTLAAYGFLGGLALSAAGGRLGRKVLVAGGANAASTPAKDAAAARSANAGPLIVVLTAIVAAPYLLWLVCDRWMLDTVNFDQRVRAFDSGLSPLVSLAWLVAAVYAGTLLELQRRRLTNWQQIDWPLAEKYDAAFRGCQAILRSIRRLLAAGVPYRPASRSPAAAAAAGAARGMPLGAALARARRAVAAALHRRRTAAGAVGTAGARRRGSGSLGRAGRMQLLALAPLAVLLLTWRRVQPAAETVPFGRLLLVAWTLTAAQSVWSCCRFLLVWRQLRKLLLRIESTPLVDRLQGVAVELQWKPMQAFSSPMPPLQTLILALKRLKALVPSGSLALDSEDSQKLLEDLDDAVGLAFAAESREEANVEIVNRRRVQRMIAAAGRSLLQHRGDPAVADFFALRAAAYLRYVFAQLRNLLVAALAPAFLLLLAGTAYTFQPRGIVSAGILGVALGEVLVAVGVFISMNRNAVLSLISGNKPGEVTFDSHFVSSLLKFGIVPILGLVATQVPAAGQLLNSWIRPILRLAGS